MQYQADIFITLRPSILDPAGAAVESSLHQLGHTRVSAVRIGKWVQLQLEAADRDQAQAQAEQMCQQMLVNPVIETYRIRLNVTDQSLETSGSTGRSA